MTTLNSAGVAAQSMHAASYLIALPKLLSKQSLVQSSFTRALTGCMEVTHPEDAQTSMTLQQAQ